MNDGEPTIGQGIRFERIRRITGYLVGGLERFNDGKAAEERDRVKHLSFKPVSEWGSGAKDGKPWN